MPRAAVNGIELAYETEGQGEPLLLIMGLGAQLVFWPERFRAQLVARGFRVIRFDNRDIGESTWLEDAPVPQLGPLLTRWMLGLSVQAPYTLDDMADDAAGLLEVLGIERAHVVGASLGGMIAQVMALRHPERIASLTSIMSTTGERRFMIPRPRALLALLAPRPRTREEAMERNVRVFRAIGSPIYDREEELLREMAGRAYDRGSYPRGFVRQLAAICASPGRYAALRSVDIPSLVIHGGRDPLVPLAGGQATAHALDAQFLVFPEMGHDLPRALWPAITDAVSDLAAEASLVSPRR